MRRHRLRGALTLIELLVVIAIIGIVLAITLPAVQSAREASRRTTCSNRLKQLALGVINHESTYQYLPSNGWGWLWIGEPGRGSGARQPGGWIYQTLPYIEHGEMNQVGSGQPDAIRRLSLAELTDVSVETLRCPSRPAADLCPRDPNIVWRNAEPRPFLSRSDYAGNGGSRFLGIFDGPLTLADGDSRSYVWPDFKDFDGIFRQRLPTRMRDVTDGLSNTYLIGEKHVSRLHYATYGDFGYDQSIVSGDDWDLIRWTEKPPQQDSDEPDPERFGSVHHTGFHMSLADGAVKFIGYEIDHRVHHQLGSRNDAQPVGWSP